MRELRPEASGFQPPATGTGPRPPQTPDLFGQLPPASGTAATTKPTPAEWPAGSDRRPVPAFAAPDRPPAFPDRALGGDYERHGANLRRADGRALVVCLSKKPTTGRRAGRYVRTVAPGSPIRYAGTLYDDAATGRDDLDGCQFQDRDTRTRYALRLLGTDANGTARYRVETVKSRRQGRGRS